MNFKEEKKMKNMLKANVVMLSVGEQQYPQDYLDKVITEINTEVKKMDCNLLGCFKVMNFSDAERVAEELKDKKVDLFIVKFVISNESEILIFLL